MTCWNMSWYSLRITNNNCLKQCPIHLQRTFHVQLCRSIDVVSKTLILWGLRLSQLWFHYSVINIKAAWEKIQSLIQLQFAEYEHENRNDSPGFLLKYTSSVSENQLESESVSRSSLWVTVKQIRSTVLLYVWGKYQSHFASSVFNA